MAMPQRDDTIEAIKRLEPPSRVRYGAPSALLEYAVMHDDEEEVGFFKVVFWRQRRVQVHMMTLQS